MDINKKVIIAVRCNNESGKTIFIKFKTDCAQLSSTMRLSPPYFSRPKMRGKNAMRQRRNELKPRSEVYDGPRASRSSISLFFGIYDRCKYRYELMPYFPQAWFPLLLLRSFRKGGNKNKNHTAPSSQFQISIVIYLRSRPNLAAVASWNYPAKMHFILRFLWIFTTNFRTLWASLALRNKGNRIKIGGRKMSRGSKATKMFANDLITSILCILMSRKFNERGNFPVHKPTSRFPAGSIFHALILGFFGWSPLHLIYWSTCNCYFEYFFNVGTWLTELWLPLLLTRNANIDDLRDD